MKKKNTALVAGVVVLALLLVFYLVLHNRNKDEAVSEEQDNTQTAYETNIDNITNVTVSSNDQEYSFSKEEDIWKYDGDHTFPLDTDAFADIIAKLKSIAADQIIEETEDIDEYGLNSPSVVVKLKKDNGDTDTLTFGDTNSVTNSSYMTVNEDSSKIYMVASAIITSLQFKINDLAQKEDFPSITSTSITELILSKDGQEMSVKKDDSSSTGWAYTGWDGSKKDADTSAVSEYTSQISSLSWSEYVSSNQESLADYGLDNPITITINYQVAVDSENDTNSDESSEESEETESETVMTDKQEILLIGAATDAGDYYAKLQSQSGIYTVSASIIDSLLNAESSQFMNSYVSNYIFADLDNVTVEKNGNTYSFTKKTEEKETEDNSEEEKTDDDTSDDKTTEMVTTYYMNDKEIELSDFSEFYSKVTGMECQEWLEKSSNTQDIPEMTIHFMKQDGLNVTTEYYAYDSNFYLVKDSKGNESLVNKMKVKEMMNAFDDLLEKVSE